MTSFVGSPGVYVNVLPELPRNTAEAVFAHFDGRQVSARMSAEAWAWWHRLCAEDYYQDCKTFEREAAKVALTWVITQSALLRMDETAFQLVRYRVPSHATDRWPNRTTRAPLR